MIRARVIGCGSALPKTIVTNDDLARRMETSDEWIRERTGIRQRHIAGEGEKTSDLALAAGREALLDAGIDANELDLVIVATTTADEHFPSVATMVQARLGMTRGAAFDVQAVCSGFIYGLSVADSMIRTGVRSGSIQLVNQAVKTHAHQTASSSRPVCTRPRAVG